MSGISRRLYKIQAIIESAASDDPKEVSIRIGPFTSKKFVIRSESLQTVTRDDRYPGSQVFGFTFKSIPEEKPVDYNTIENFENKLRFRYPKYRSVLKRFHSENKLLGDAEDIKTWSFSYAGAPIAFVDIVTSHILDLIKFVLLTPPGARLDQEFLETVQKKEAGLLQYYQGYNEAKKMFFEQNHILGQFNDVLSWYGLESTDQLREFKAPSEIKGFFKALGRASNFFISKDMVIRLRGDTVTRKQMKCAAKKMWAIRAMITRGPKGLLIYDDRRLLIYVYFILVIVIMIICLIKTPYLDEPFEAIGSLLTVLISVPALWSFVSNDEDPIWAALRGQRYLCDDRDVIKTFSLTKKEIAIFGLVDGGCSFLSNKRMCHNSDGGTDLIKPGPRALTTTKELRMVGIFVGRQMARREWESTNFKVVRDSNEELHITDQVSPSLWSMSVATEVDVG